MCLANTYNKYIGLPGSMFSCSLGSFSFVPHKDFTMFLSSLMICFIPVFALQEMSCSLVPWKALKSLCNGKVFMLIEYQLLSN